MRNFKIIFSIFLIIAILVSLTACNNGKNNEDMKSKIIEEMDYLDTKIVSISNKLNNISLQNYEITSEEISIEQESSGGGESSSGGSSSRRLGRRRK